MPAAELDELGRRALKPLQRADWQRLLARRAELAGDAAAALQASREAWQSLQAALPAGHPGLLAPGVAHLRRLLAAGAATEAQVVRAALAPAAAVHVPASPWRRAFFASR